jgi:hypothetical protein
MTTAMGLQQQTKNNSPNITTMRHRWLPSHTSNQRRPWSMTPGVRPAVTWAYSDWHYGSGGHAAKPTTLPLFLPPTLPPDATPPATPLRGGPPGSRQRRQARPWTGKTVPRIRQHPSSTQQPCRAGGPYSRPGQSTTGTVQEGAGGGAAPPPLWWGWGGGGGCAGGGGIAMPPPPLVSLLRCNNSGGLGAGVSLETTDDKQTTNKHRQRMVFDKGVSTLCPYHPPPQRHNLPLGLGGGDGRI